MQNNNYLLLITKSALLVILFFGCRSSNKISNLNIAALYEIENNELDLNYSVNHTDENSSTLIIGLNSNKLLYSKSIENGNVVYNSEFTVSYMIMEGIENEVIVDSSSIYKKITDRSYQNINFNIPLKQGKSYWIKTVVTDNIRQFNSYNLLYVNKFDGNSAGYFQNTNGTDIKQNYNSYWVTKDSIELSYQIKTHSKLYALPINVIYKIPSTPYDVRYYETDTFKKGKYQLINLNNKNEFKLQLTNDLVYLKTDTNSTQGCLFLKTNNSFPRITEIDELILPLQYITSKSEYNSIINATDKKAEFEKFWIEQSGSKEQARKAIKQYYTKVTEANKKFTTYKPGWLTDMGMVYIVKGAPETVKRSNSREIWFYRDSNTSDAEMYSFDLTNSTIFKYHYTLNRMNEYKYSWEKHIELCREGR